MIDRDVVICEPLRTPVGRYGGALRDIPAPTLAAGLIQELVRRGLPPDAVDDVLLGQCYPSAEAPAIGRVAALDAGLPVEASGLQIDRRCGSGLQAVIYATLQVSTGASDLVLAGGAESMSQAPFFSTAMRWGARGDGVMLHDALARGRTTAGGQHHPVPGGMLETAENLRAEYAISRERAGPSSPLQATESGSGAAVGRVRRRDRAPSSSRIGRANASWTPTSTLARTRRSTHWPRCARCAGPGRGLDRDRRELERPERRRIPVRGDHPHAG